MALLGALLLLLGALGAAPPAAEAAPVCTPVGATVTCVYASTGAEDTFVVPAGVTTVQVAAVGAAGGANGFHPETPSGRGARVTGTLTGLSDGQTLYVAVGGAATTAT